MSTGISVPWCVRFYIHTCMCARECIFMCVCICTCAHLPGCEIAALQPNSQQRKMIPLSARAVNEEQLCPMHFSASQSTPTT